MYDSDKGYYRSRYGYEDAPVRKEPAKPEEPEIRVTAYAEEAEEKEDFMEPEEAPKNGKDGKDGKDEKDFKHGDCEFYEGNSVAFEIKKCDCEIRADIVLKKNKCIRIWGRVKSCYGEPIQGALVKLVKVACWHGKYQYVGIAHTITDCKGFYQFDLCDKEDKGEFRIIVSKPATGKERVIPGFGCCKFYGEKDAEPDFV